MQDRAGIVYDCRSNTITSQVMSITIESIEKAYGA